MVRVIIGAVPAAIAMFLIGFIFFATPLSRLSYASLDNAQAAAVQTTLASSLPTTGTYEVPGLDTREQTDMYAKGPIATIHYNTRGFGAMEPQSLILGLVLDFITALLIGAALIGIDRRVPDFASRGKLVAIFAVAASAFIHFEQPIFYHYGWGYFIYMFIADAAMLAAGGLILARWFLPKGQSAPAEHARHDDGPAAGSDL
jgi:hypothetical protein